MGKRTFDFSLVDISRENQAIATPGGYCIAAAAGAYTLVETFHPTTKVSLGYEPLALNRGAAQFSVDDDVLEIDVFGIAPTGHSFVVFGIGPGFANLGIDTSRRYGQSLTIPFDARQSAAWDDNVAKDVMWLPRGILANTGAVFVAGTDSGETINVGFGSDEDGLISAVSLAATGVVPDNGAPAVRTSDGNLASRKVTATLSGGSDSAYGYAVVPYDIIGSVSW